MEKIIEDLEKMIDLKYKDFNSSLIPSKSKQAFLGVRVPYLRNYAKNMDKSIIEPFFNELPHKYYEEVMIHRYIIENTKNYDEMIYELNRLLPYLDSWAETDGFRNKAIEKNKKDFLKEIKKWLKSKHVYTVRFAVGMLMSYYLDDDFKPEYLNLVGSINTKGEYYLQMMIAWYFATALAKQYEKTIEYFVNSKLDSFTYNKTIQKANESYLIDEETKKYLKTLKRV